MKAFVDLLRILSQSDVEFIVIVESPPFYTVLHVLHRIWMSCISPYPRGAPEGLPFQWEAETLRAGLNFTLITKLGAIDLFGEITGGGTYETLIRHSEKATLLGVSFSYLNLEKLIEVKRAAGRLKDFEVLAELEAIQEERE